jgi:hypothetical protein
MKKTELPDDEESKCNENRCFNWSRCEIMKESIRTKYYHHTNWTEALQVSNDKNCNIIHTMHYNYN